MRGVPCSPIHQNERAPNTANGASPASAVPYGVRTSVQTMGYSVTWLQRYRVSSGVSAYFVLRIKYPEKGGGIDPPSRGATEGGQSGRPAIAEWGVRSAECGMEPGQDKAAGGGLKCLNHFCG
jgi:hypothetical protein